MPWLGEICALVAPLCWSVAILFYRRISTDASPTAMTLFKNVFATALLLATMALLGITFPTDRTLFDWSRLAASGILGLAVADTLLFHALRRIGAAKVAIVDTLYAPTVVVLSFVFLHDRLGPAFLAGGALVVAGVGLANWRPADGADPADKAHADKAHALVGTLFGVGAILGTSVGVILSKPVLEASNLIEVTATRMAFGVVAQLVWTGARRDWGAFDAFRPAANLWQSLVPASVIGTYLSLLFWMGGFKWAPAPVAAVLNQLATVYILVLARTVLREPVAGYQFAGGALAVCGALVVVLTR